MDMIFTEASSIEEANEIGHFIMKRGYEGVQNDSYRYCDLMICAAIRNNKRHHKDEIYIGVGRSSMIISQTKRGLRRRGLTFIEKKRKFYELCTDKWQERIKLHEQWVKEHKCSKTFERRMI